MQTTPHDTTPHDTAPAVFLVRDKSGRGFAARLTMEDILATWDADDIDNADPDDEYSESFRDWMSRAEVYDEYHHDTARADILRIE